MENRNIEYLYRIPADTFHGFSIAPHALASAVSKIHRYHNRSGSPWNAAD